jgi:hypothetical protein
MPALFTHHLFALAFAKNHQTTFPFLFQYQSLLTLGAQGPDPFFFYGQYPFRKRENKDQVVQIGSYLHHHDPAINLRLLFKETLSLIQKFPMHAPMLLAYVLGAVSHYVLDRTIHPYVFYRSGFDHEGGLSAPYHADHADLEANIDRALMNFYSVKPSSMNPKQTLNVEQPYLKMISTLYTNVYSNLKLQVNTFYDAVNDMQSIYQFLYDGLGIKKTIWTLIAGKRSVPAALSHTPSINKEKQALVLNLHHAPWKNPCTKVEYQTSIPELIDQALTLMDRFVILIQKTLQGNELNVSDFETLVEGVNYDGHLFTDRMKTFHSIYPSFRGTKTNV